MPHRNLASTIIMLAVALLGMPACARDVPQASPEELATIFYRMAVYRETPYEVQGITKWTEPVEVHLLGSVDSRSRAEIAATLDRIREITRLNITISKTVDQPSLEGAEITWSPAGQRITVRSGDSSSVEVSSNFIVLFLRPEALERLQWELTPFVSHLLHEIRSGHSACRFLLTASPQTLEIRSALIVIPTDRPEWLISRCVHEETIQSFGLTTDIPGSNITLFNKIFSPDWVEPTKYDWLLLRLLYDSRIEPGATGQPLMDKAFNIIRGELLRE